MTSVLLHPRLARRMVTLWRLMEPRPPSTRLDTSNAYGWVLDGGNGWTMAAAVAGNACRRTASRWRRPLDDPSSTEVGVGGKRNENERPKIVSVLCASSTRTELTQRDQTTYSLAIKHVMCLIHSSHAPTSSHASHHK